ncbi:MAG: DUF885 domain-containing protein [Undibacterium sp.]|nr:DUF885 domain-containing protein [Undibacterium sp.]
MKKTQTILTPLLLCLFTGLTSVATNSFANETDRIDQFIANYSKTYVRLGLDGEMDLSYQKQIKLFLESKTLPQQTAFFQQLKKQSTAIKQSPVLKQASSCQALQLQQIDFEIELHQEKLALIKRYQALGTQAHISDQGLAKSSLGKAWYALLRKAWLTTDSQPEQLMEMGKSELKHAQERYLSLQTRMGYAGRDTEFFSYLQSAAFDYPDGSTPQADYEHRQAIIEQHMTTLFFPNSIHAPHIKASTQGAALPVDGYYEPEEKTFYFNRSKSHYQRRDIDWLLLHESTPGHHYQSRYAIEQAACPTPLPHGFYSAYAEGWGAYVETLGKELGLFQQDADELGAVEWDLVRSIRVILDVGINYLAWSEQDAKDFWQTQLPMLPALADREIKRVRNWPAQAITYKLGAVKFRQLREAEQQRLGKNFDLRQFHHSMLKFGPLPIAILDQVLVRDTP